MTGRSSGQSIHSLSGHASPASQCGHQLGSSPNFIAQLIFIPGADGHRQKMQLLWLLVEDLELKLFWGWRKQFT